MKYVTINHRKIGAHFPPYVVAEVSANHNGKIENAKAIMLSAKKNGADAAKLQTYTPDTLTIDSDKPDFLINEGLWAGNNLYELYKQAYTPFEWHKDLFDYARQIEITCFSSPFDKTAVDLLEDLNAPAYKIASFEAIDLPLIQYVAQTGKPMIISTGMANLVEIEEALDAARTNGCQEIILLHCISAYPAPIEESNLKTILDMASRFSIVTGLSDHTLGTTASITAVALGASFIEKHFTLSRQDKGPDSSFSLEPEELKALCTHSKDAWLALGNASFERKESEKSNTMFRRSLYFVQDAIKGAVLDESIVRSIRPGYGLAPKYYPNILGRKLKMDVERGTPVSWEVLEEK